MAEHRPMHHSEGRSGLQRVVRRHVALAWVIASIIGVFVFAYAINLTRF
jgi:hypothetical protein